MTTQDHPDWTAVTTPAQIVDGVTDLRATLVASASGATTLINGVSTKSIVVRALVISANAAVNFKFQSHTTPTDITGLLYTDSKGGFVLPYLQSGWFATIAGQALDINLSGGVAVGGLIVYGTV